MVLSGNHPAHLDQVILTIFYCYFTSNMERSPLVIVESDFFISLEPAIQRSFSFILNEDLHHNYSLLWFFYSSNPFEVFYLRKAFHLVDRQKVVHEWRVGKPIFVSLKLGIPHL